MYLDFCPRVYVCCSLLKDSNILQGLEFTTYKFVLTLLNFLNCTIVVLSNQDTLLSVKTEFKKGAVSQKW